MREIIFSDDVLAHASEDHTRAGYNFAEYLAFWLTSPACWMFKTPDTLLMIIEHTTEKRWHVHYAYNASPQDFLLLFLQRMPHWHETISWARPLKNRQLVLRHYSARKLFAHAGLSPATIPGFPG